MNHEQSYCLHCHKELQKGRHAFGLCSNCRAKYRFHNDKEYREKWDKKQKMYYEKYRDKRRMISRISDWKIHGRNFETVNESATYKGRYWEYYAHGILNADSPTVDVNKIKWGEHYDLVWKGKKIDVKSSNIGKQGFWSFANSKHSEADYFFCICLDNNNPVKVYFIPKEHVDKGISIGQRTSKFDKYLIYPFFKLPKKL